MAICRICVGQSYTIEYFVQDTSKGFILNPSGQANWGKRFDGVVAKVTVRLADGQLTFKNTVDPELNALAFGNFDKTWNNMADGNDLNFNFDYLAAAATTSGDRLPQTGPTSTGDTFHEAALWRVKDSQDPAPGSAPGATVKELFATWVNPDGAVQQTRLFTDDDSIGIAAREPLPNAGLFAAPVRLILREA